VMRKEYDLHQLKARHNPYAKSLKKTVTIRLGTDVVNYFKAMAGSMGVPYQGLINLYLRDCAQSHKKLTWAA